MRRRLLFALLLALLSGTLIRAGEIWQPLRLRAFHVIGGTAAVEKDLRQWSSDFMNFWPKGLFKGGSLKALEEQLPLTFRRDWAPLEGSLTITVASAQPAVSLLWRGRTYYLSASGLLWSHELASKYTTLLPQGLPTATLADDFPLVKTEEEEQEESMKPVTLKAQWLLDVMKKVRTSPGLVATDVMLRRRGGEDLVACTLRSEKGGDSLRFLGRIERLDLSLAIARQLFESGETKGFALLDATYDDKVFLRPKEGQTP